MLYLYVNILLPRLTFPLFSSDGNFQINEGDVLAANIHDAHRDLNYFSEPEEFDPSRFVDKVRPFFLASFSLLIMLLLLP